MPERNLSLVEEDMANTGKYIPALRFNILTPFYDPLLKLFMRESKFKRELIHQAKIEKGNRVLDLGCGTGTLTILIKQIHPEVEVFGLDGDKNVLQMARRKAAEARVELNLDLGMVFELPYADPSFQRVLSSLVIHHLTTANKQRALQEAYRVLIPGGELHIADFGRPHNFVAYLISLIVRRFEEASDNIRGLLPEMLTRAGFREVEESARYMTIFGTLVLLRARKPG